MNIDYVKVIHRFWSGRDIPPAYIEYGEQWKALNPDWEVADWGIEALEEFPELGAVFDSLYDRDAGRYGIELYVQIADVIGYALVEKFGGIYMNMDIQPIRPLPELPAQAWATYENHEDGRIVNAAIGAPRPSDVFWWSLLRGLPERYFANPTAEMVETTGPAYLTDHAYSRPRDLVVLPVETFNIVHWKNIPSGGDASLTVQTAVFPPEVIGIHHWGHRKDGRSNYVETATA